jgi:hypothetical protein
MCALPARHYDECNGALDWAALPGQIATLFDRRDAGATGAPVLACPPGAATVRPDGFVLFPPAGAPPAGAAMQVPPTWFTQTGEALVKGKKPQLRLAFRAVAAGGDGAGGTAVAAVADAASAPFEVTSTRTKGNMKVEVPSVDTEVRAHALPSRALPASRFEVRAHSTDAEVRARTRLPVQRQALHCALQSSCARGLKCCLGPSCELRVCLVPIRPWQSHAEWLQAALAAELASQKVVTLLAGVRRGKPTGGSHRAPAAGCSNPWRPRAGAEDRARRRRSQAAAARL